MGLLADIQMSLLNEQPIGPLLLKLRFLADRLGSTTLEEWVKHEAEGYPRDVAVPEYRKFGVTYVADFNGSFGRQIQSMTIPPYLIAKLAGERWLLQEDRQSVSALEDLIAQTDKPDGSLSINASNLIGLLSNSVFQGWACHAAYGKVSRASLVGAIGTLRARVLELTLQLERQLPEAREIAAGQAPQTPEPEKAAMVTHIINQVVNGSVASNVANSGNAAQFNITVPQGDERSLAKVLRDAGITDTDADQFAKIVASEKPEGADQPFGAKAKAWLGSNAGKAWNGTWKIGADVATALLTSATKQYYGLT